MIRRGSMWEMTGHARVITLIGAGGKTTSLLRLGQEIQAAGHEAVLTTTTKVWPVQNLSVWRDSLVPPPSVNSDNLTNSSKSRLWFWYDRIDQESGKWIGPVVEIVDKAVSDTDGGHANAVWVIEGDGAKGRGFKCWAEHEPQIPLKTECAILVIDGTLWGKRLSDAEIHRSESCQNFSGRVLDVGLFWEYIFASPVFSESYTKMPWVVLLNEKGVGERINLEQFVLPKDLYSVFHCRENPVHLRLAAGNSRAGEMRWVDV